MTNKQPMTEALKRAITSSGLTFKALEHETGVTRQSLMAFIKGARTLRLDMADRVANYFGLTVGPASKAKQKGKLIEVQLAGRNDGEPPARHGEMKLVSSQPETEPAANLTIELAMSKSKRKKAERG